MPRLRGMRAARFRTLRSRRESRFPCRYRSSSQTGFLHQLAVHQSTVQRDLGVFLSEHEPLLFALLIPTVVAATQKEQGMSTGAQSIVKHLRSTGGSNGIEVVAQIAAPDRCTRPQRGI